MAERTAREDSEIVAGMIRKDLARAIDSTDILIEEQEGIEMAEVRALKATRDHLLLAMAALNEAPALTGLVRA